jgi:mannitol/fructose-specific phosphotransferase system IIA component (Ntr-type)
MSSDEVPAVEGLRPHYLGYQRQKCFIAYSEQAAWSGDLLAACEAVLGREPFQLEMETARRHLEPGVHLRNKVMELIANSRYGIYDLSYFKDTAGSLQLPCNVYIELGIAVTLNRPTLLLWNAKEPGTQLPECLHSMRDQIVEFTGVPTLKRALEERLPKWIDAPPDREWINRVCVFGGRSCEFREAHPRVRRWEQAKLACHISHGPDTDCEDFCALVGNVLGLYKDVKIVYASQLLVARGYQFQVCSHCQTIRSSPLGIYRITPRTPPETYLAIGASMGLELQFEYRIPRILVTEEAAHLPSLLKGFDVVEARSDTDVERQLKAFLPAVLRTVKQSAWKSKPLPFAETPLEPLERPERNEVLTHPAGRPITAPSPPAIFVGRAQQLRYLTDALLHRSGTVCLIGPPGMGKSALGLQFAHSPDVADAFRDGVLWADVSTLNISASRPPALWFADIAVQWLQSLGFAVDASSDPRETLRQLRAALANKRCLTVLDDVPQRLMESREWLADITGPECSTLIIPLGAPDAASLADASFIRLTPLTINEVRQLLRETLGSERADNETRRAEVLMSLAQGSPHVLTQAIQIMRAGGTLDDATREISNVTVDARVTPTADKMGAQTAVITERAPPRSQIADHLKIECVKVPLAATTKWDAIAELLQLISEQYPIKNIGATLEHLREREARSRSGTYIGEFVAIPHCKIEMGMDFADDTWLSIGKASQPIPWEDDGWPPCPVELVVLAISGIRGSLISVLAGVAAVLRSDRVRDGIRRANSASELLKVILHEEAELR